MIVSPQPVQSSAPRRPFTLPRIRVVSFVLSATVGIALVPDARVASAQPRDAHVLRTPPLLALASRDAVRTLIASAVDAGVHTLIIPIPLFPDDDDGARRSVANVVQQARARGLRLLASVDVMAAADADAIPLSRTHLLYSHPEWLMVPRAVAVELLPIDARTPGYLGRLARWTRAHRAEAPSLYVSPLDHDAAAFLATAVRDLVTRYDLDGVHIARARFPSPDFDFSRHALDLFRVERQLSLTVAERARMDQIEPIDPFAYPNEYPDDWRRFMRTRLAALIADIETTLRSARASAIVSVEDGPDVTGPGPDAPSLSSRRDDATEPR